MGGHTENGIRQRNPGLRMRERQAPGSAAGCVFSSHFRRVPDAQGSNGCTLRLRAVAAGGGSLTQEQG